MRAQEHKNTRARVFFFTAAVLLVFSSQGVGFAQAVSSAELINRAKEYDGKTVTYQGEVIGDVMARGDFAWVNVHDGKAAIGIWVGKKQAQQITLTGGYRITGDRVAVSGEFHQRCPEHGGDLDIHAAQLEVIAKGVRLVEEPHTDKARLALVFGVILGILWISSLLNRR